MGYAILTVTLLLLLQHGTEEAALTIDSKSTGNWLTGDNISLIILYNVQPPDPIIFWAINGTTVARWFNGIYNVSKGYSNRLQIGDASLLLANATKNDSGKYTITVFVLSDPLATQSFQVKVYDRVENVTVTQNPLSVDEKTPEVKLACSASGDVELVTWTREGQILGYNDTYNLQDGNKTLQIKNPNRTYTGTYICHMSNPVSLNNGSWQLNVSYSPADLSGGAIAGIVVGSVVGGLLLIALVVLLLWCCMRKKKNVGNEKKKAEPQHKDVLRTVSGNTLSPDDPAYFTMNNIMYRNSSISMGSYVMNYNDSESYYKTPTSKPPSSSQKVKLATQV